MTLELILEGLVNLREEREKARKELKEQASHMLKVLTDDFDNEEKICLDTNDKQRLRQINEMRRTLAKLKEYYDGL